MYLKIRIQVVEVCSGSQESPRKHLKNASKSSIRLSHYHVIEQQKTMQAAEDALILYIAHSKLDCLIGRHMLH